VRLQGRRDCCILNGGERVLLLAKKNKLKPDQEPSVKLRPGRENKGGNGEEPLGGKAGIEESREKKAKLNGVPMAAPISGWNVKDSWSKIFFQLKGGTGGGLDEILITATALGCGRNLRGEFHHFRKARMENLGESPRKKEE